MTTKNEKNVCNICKTDPPAPYTKFLQSSCGHTFCDTCIKNHFAKIGTLICQVCKTSLAKTSFAAPLEDDEDTEKEFKIRKDILRNFNKRREDFHSLREYNDYLEHVEEIIANLVKGVDVEKHKAAVKKNKKENAAIIERNKGRKKAEEKEIKRQIGNWKDKEAEEKKREQSKTEEAKAPEPPPVKKTFAYVPQAAPAQPAAVAPTFALPQPVAATAMDTGALTMPAALPLEADPEKKRSRDQIAAKAAGWKDDFVRERALQEAMSSLML
eukprot:TRINITY_DN3615_c0_g1_i1.p1 TRINITY_DN3615_c0_g1~~TRINITY_DN3615_c0_g1_i1.p1  ORF type:complete len:270 (+),score=75.75 TRINITY_DN3615_c0_g1_i1:159-968(+)